MLYLRCLDVLAQGHFKPWKNIHWLTFNNILDEEFI